jgi:hypothetical protein
MKINKFTKDFHSHDFPGWSASGSAWDYEEFWYRKDIPWLEVPLELKTNNTHLELKSQHQSLFSEISEQQNTKLDAINKDRYWFFSDHQFGWQSCVISRKNYPALASQIKNTELPEQVIQPTLHSDVCMDLLNQITDLGLKILWTDVKALIPGGWIQPHVDPKVEGTSTMEYFWIPINDCSPNIKIWPAGYIKQKVGNMYLVNNQTFLHSVINQDPWTRYVLTGRIDKNSLSPELRQLVSDSFQQQWC